MNSLTKPVGFCVLVAFCGCITTTTENGRQVPNRNPGISGSVKKITAPMKQMVRAVTPKDTLDPIPWDWATGIPHDVAKSESIPAVVPLEAVAAFVPTFSQSDVRLVSTSAPAPLSIQVVNDTRVRSYADLHSGVEKALGKRTEKLPVLEVSYTVAGSASSPLAVTYNSLVALEHATLPERSTTRIVEDGNPWVMIKDDAVRCKLMVRREQRSRLVHVVVATKVCWGPPVRLPIDLHAKCGGQELRCMGVAEVLSRLYDDEKTQTKPSKVFEGFNQVAERDDYLVPVNYKHLEAKLASNTRLASIRPEPAFATVGGYAYPGPPVLGDARALSGFMLQPKVYSADEDEHVGWVVFEDVNSNASGNLEIAIDLGSGPQSVPFNVPK